MKDKKYHFNSILSLPLFYFMWMFLKGFVVVPCFLLSVLFGGVRLRVYVSISYIAAVTTHCIAKYLLKSRFVSPFLYYKPGEQWNSYVFKRYGYCMDVSEMGYFPGGNGYIAWLLVWLSLNIIHTFNIIT